MPRISTAVFLGFAILLAVVWTGSAYAGGNTGAVVYANSCAGCHGATGRGDGTVAGVIYFRPRNFALGKFKFGGAPSQIARTVRRGLPGTAMPAFAASLTSKNIRAVSAYVRKFVPGKVPATFTPPSPPVGISSAKLAARGAASFADSCAMCHGSSGRGDGPSSRSLEDASGDPIRPTNLVEAPFAGGETPGDIYTRLHQGIPGTPMPAFGDTYSSSQLWDIVAFVKSIRKNSGSRGQNTGSISATRIKTHGAVSQGLDDPAWANAPVSTLALNPLWRRPSWPTSIKVSALASPDEIALLFSWPDAAPNRRQSMTGADFLDAVAVMFPENSSQQKPPPFIGMGSKKSHGNVRIIQWRALSEPKGPGAAYPNLYPGDANPWRDKTMATPARAVGNPIAGAAPPAVIEYVAAGAGTLTYVRGGRVLNEARWSNGRWRVFIARPRAGIPSLSKSSVWAAFAVWDGGAHDRNGQKSITKWIRLNLGRK